MTNYIFRLAPGYCLYNGAAVLKQNGSEITFLIENFNNFELRGRLERAFKNYVAYVCKQNDCPEVYKRKVQISFKAGNRTEIKRCLSSFYSAEFGQSMKNLAGSNAVVPDGKTGYGNGEGIAPEEKFYGMDKTLKVSGGDKNGSEKTDDIEDAAAILLLESILEDARAKKVTDIHIEDNCVRFRMGGVLVKQMELQEKRGVELVQRIKLISGMNVVEKRKSQDGHFVFGDGKKEGKAPSLFVRVSAMPVAVGCGSESVVLRLLDVERNPLILNELGFNQNQLERLDLLSGAGNGLILICGPTGAGKSTTAAAFLRSMVVSFNGGKKILSLEDPPEYVIEGVTQIQVEEERNNSFESLLNHIFRQDPDVIMVGEIRDEKSAAGALRASLTGHLVVATLHTSSASGAFLRLENLGLERKLIASVLRGVVVQELNYFGKEPCLLAEVCFPCEGFADKVKENLSQSELEALFDSEINGREVLAKTIKLMQEENKGKCKNLFAPAYEVEPGVNLKRKKHSYLPLIGVENGFSNSIAGGAGYSEEAAGAGGKA